MSSGKRQLITLKQIEGVISPHTEYVTRELEFRKEVLKYVGNVAELADYIGGTVTELRTGEDWAIKKEVFPGVEIFFLYRSADAEFPSSFRVLYSGERIKTMPGDDLASITIACANHIVRYVKEVNPDKSLPEICYKV